LREEELIKSEAFLPGVKVFQKRKFNSEEM